MYEATVCLGDAQAGGLGARHGMELVWYHPCCRHGAKENWSPVPRKVMGIKGEIKMFRPLGQMETKYQTQGKS